MSSRRLVERWIPGNTQEKILGWSLFYHSADIGVRGTGATVEMAFEQAAKALTAVITDPEAVQPLESVELQCEASDLELLLVDWLNALIYEMAVRHLLFSRFTVSIDGTHLSAQVWGEAIDVPRHQPAVEVKGATYTELKVCEESSGQWLAQCVVDV